MNSSKRSFLSFYRIVVLKAFYSALVSGVCDSPWFQLDDACYYVSPNGNSEQMESWHQSQSWCLQKGGYLATIEDLDERRLITNLTQNGTYNGAMWIGLNRLEDRINYKWVDGSTSEFRDWAVGEPNDDSNGMCAFQLTHPSQDCFTRNPGVNTVNGLFDNPHHENRPHTFYFGYLAGLNDVDGSAECQSRCSVEPLCYSYTFISNTCPDHVWMGECTGRSNEYNVSDPYQYAISGTRYICGESGFWYVGHCGEKRGFICKRDGNSTVTPSPTKLPTPTVPGFCPAGYFDAGGNKCFKIVVGDAMEGMTWDMALALCRAEPGIAPDLASILSEYENAAITMHLRNEYWGFWIGLRLYDLSSDQWLWTDNQDATYLNWASGKPSGSAKCTELWTDPGPAGTWNNQECTYRRGYICQTYKDSSSIIVTPPSTPAHTCMADYYNYGGICYKKLITGSSWSSALATCEEDGATLATIHSEAQNSALYVFGSDIAPFWIGYHKNENNEWVWTDGWPDIYSNWNAGEEPGTGGGCASYKDNGKWKDDECTNNLTAICMISTAPVPTTPAPVEGVCPSSDWVEYGGHCYYFSDTFDSLNWEMAQAKCGSKAGLLTVGNLVSIHSAYENQFIYEHLEIQGIDQIWIGLHEESQGSPLKWSDGSELQYVRWAPGEPNGQNGSQPCVEMYASLWPGMWNDHLCPERRPYVCKAPKASVSVICDSPWFQLDDACYYVSPNGNSEQVASWHQSQNWCLQNGGHLATIEDIDERRLIANLTQGGIYNGALWIGLNKLEDRINYKWVDGSTSEFRDWAVGEPNDDSDGMCVFQLTHPKQDCFTRDPGVNTVNGLFNNPHNESRPHTFYFGYLAGLDDVEGSAECQSRCSVEPACYSYTFISNTCPDYIWKGECMGRSNEQDVSDPAQYAISGTRYNCDESGYWYVGNCGEKRGFICKKGGNSTVTPSPTKLPTPTVPGFCPAGYFDAGGNKCFKIVVDTAMEGLTWELALELCRAESGIAPDLASILSEYENAAITMHIRDEYWGFWIGLRQSDLFSDQWLWTDNQDVTYSNWASGKPSGSAKCTELWTNPGPAGTWNNQDCMQRRGYICQAYKDANSIIVTPPNTPAHTCQTDYYNYGGICYGKLTTGSSWSSALATCEADGATLATIHSEAENSALYVFGSDIAPFWIGYHKNENNEWVWTDGWPDIYSNWNAGEEPGTGGGCASYKDNGKWKDDECTNNLTAICMISTATVPTTPAPVEGVCPSSDWVEYGSSCYYFSDTFDSLNWEMAKAKCGSKAGYYTAGNLVSIHSAIENQFIYEHLKDQGANQVWIGLYKEAQGSPHKWSDGSEMQYDRWAPGEPNDQNGTQPCVEMYVTMWPGMWNDHLCYESRPYVCKAPKVDQPPTPTIPPEGVCEIGWKAYGAYCYFLDLSKTVTFNEAQETCVGLAGRYASLVTIPDAYTNLFLMEMVKEVSSAWEQIWIGLTRPNKDAEFRWIDKSDLNFTNWAPGEPNNQGNEHCAEIQSTDGVWNDMNCETNHLHYICQIKRENMPPPTTTSKPESPNSGIYLTSGEMAGVILGTMLGTIAMVGIGLVLYSVFHGGLPFYASKKPDATDTASTYDLPYNNFEEQPYGTLSRSSSMKSSADA